MVSQKLVVLKHLHSTFLKSFVFIWNYVSSLWKHFIEMFIYVSKPSRSLVNFTRP